ncbi:hypothetical protein KY290_026811 [Solanum tuberosum]|uniref:Retrotransposon gag protein n=1 Tax=Solanum tuberosum TaxID=4113 RepID=A0ABQ7UXK9_SOLTU|nr:hypothetical protein KY284_024850 [Solanum tuberosum]KAH0756541.1 hypothetical protein KY290_026811 [Solanum tuberosum]
MEFFDVDKTPDDSRVKLASCNFEGKELQWHQSYMKHKISREWPRWTEYVGSLFARFGAELFDDPMGDFKDLRQMLAPRSLAKAVNLARIQEQTLVVQKQVFSEPSTLSNPRNIHRLAMTNSSFSYGSNQPTKNTLTTSISPFVVSVADGKKIQSNYVCKKLSWKMQGVSFDSDMLVLPIGGCNMVLGIQWLITLGDIMWNIRRLKMEFTFMGAQNFLKRNTICCSKDGSSGQHGQVANKTSRALYDFCILEEYSDLFEVPKYLPPSRLHDHKIMLQDGTFPINIRPYRYPTVQKDEIEKMVENMLHSRDYRELNSDTVKDKFPIPVIEQLLDELHVYSQSWNAHMSHLRETFKILRSHVLFVKKSKCAFGAQ